MIQFLPVEIHRALVPQYSFGQNHPALLINKAWDNTGLRTLQP
jgi:hypothetical protein